METALLCRDRELNCTAGKQDQLPGACCSRDGRNTQPERGNQHTGMIPALEESQSSRHNSLFFEQEGCNQSRQTYGALHEQNAFRFGRMQSNRLFVKRGQKYQPRTHHKAACDGIQPSQNNYAGMSSGIDRNTGGCGAQQTTRRNLCKSFDGVALWGKRISRNHLPFFEAIRKRNLAFGQLHDLAGLLSTRASLLSAPRFNGTFFNTEQLCGCGIANF
jgi:hypothetical protein